MSMKQRRIVITGVSRGLGRAMARRLAAEGHVICGCGRDTKHLQTLSAELGTGHSVEQVDVADASSVQQWADRVLPQFGTPDLLINNAAIINLNARLWEVAAEEFDRVMAINVTGTANVIRSFVPAMIVRASGRQPAEQPGGVIVNFSSGWGRSVSPEVAPYCASKWAIEGLTQALAVELPSGMCAVPLNPGIINTDMLRSCFAQEAETYPDADAWAGRAVPFILQLGPRHNGQSLSVPD